MLAGRFKEIGSLLKPAFIYVLESEIVMKFTYDYVLVGEEITIYEEKSSCYPQCI